MKKKKKKKKKTWDSVVATVKILKIGILKLMFVIALETGLFGFYNAMNMAGGV